jgi:hypothetical protein
LGRQLVGDAEAAQIVDGPHTAERDRANDDADEL